jgi:hypothetical protein
MMSALRCRSDLEPLRLPEDIWVGIVEHLTINDLRELACVSTKNPFMIDVIALMLLCSTQTSKALAHFVQTSRIIWQHIVRDLLAVTPNASIFAGLSTYSIAELRRLAFRYELTAGCHPQPEGPERYETSFTENVTCTISSTARLVPGMPYMIMGNTDASIHLISTRTGQSVDVWNHVEDIEARYCIIGLSTLQGENGPVFEVIIGTM